MRVALMTLLLLLPFASSGSARPALPVDPPRELLTQERFVPGQAEPATAYSQMSGQPMGGPGMRQRGMMRKRMMMGGEGTGRGRMRGGGDGMRGGRGMMQGRRMMRRRGGGEGMAGQPGRMRQRMMGQERMGGSGRQQRAAACKDQARLMNRPTRSQIDRAVGPNREGMMQSFRQCMMRGRG